MLILWIRKRKTDEQTRQQESGKDGFRKHAEDMKRFRLSHPQEIEVITSRDIRDIMTPDGDILAAVQKVSLSEHAQN